MRLLRRSSAGGEVNGRRKPSISREVRGQKAKTQSLATGIQENVPPLAKTPSCVMSRGQSMLRQL
jgi:hypothetical protein